jgi:hypothetical protein
MKLSRNRPCRPIRLRDIEDLTLSRQSVDNNVRLSASCISLALRTGLFYFYLLYLFFLEAEKIPGLSAAERIR